MTSFVKSTFGNALRNDDAYPDEYLKDRIAEGIPEFVAPFLFDWVKGFNLGEWDQVSGDLEKLIGHRPTTAEEYIRSAYR